MDSPINRSAFGGTGDHGRRISGRSVARRVTLGFNRVRVRIARAALIGWQRLTHERVLAWPRAWSARSYSFFL